MRITQCSPCTCRHSYDNHAIGGRCTVRGCCCSVFDTPKKDYPRETPAETIRAWVEPPGNTKGKRAILALVACVEAAIEQSECTTIVHSSRHVFMERTLQEGLEKVAEDLPEKG